METLTIEQPTTQSILPEIAALNFDRIKFKMLHKDEGNGWSKEMIDRAELEYKRYLTLITLNGNRSIVPSKLMDEFWHMHILDTRAYRRDCQKIFGRFLDHFPYFGIFSEDDHQNLLDSFEETKRLYFQTFGCEMADGDEARCEGHPCHAPSSCRCRAPGACK